MEANQVEKIIKQRRTVKTDRMNGEAIPDEVVQELLASADWAPTHARTEPWRFIVFDNNTKTAFCEAHANLYKDNTEETAFLQAKYDNLLHMGDNASHIIIAYMKRVASHKIPEIEEVTAAACAIQNLLLMATANDVVCFWSTGGLAHHPAMREHFKLDEEDRVLGILYLGYTNEPIKEGSRMIPLSEKIFWEK